MVDVHIVLIVVDIDEKYSVSVSGKPCIRCVVGLFLCELAGISTCWPDVCRKEEGGEGSSCLD